MNSAARYRLRCAAREVRRMLRKVDRCAYPSPADDTASDALEPRLRILSPTARRMYYRLTS